MRRSLPLLVLLLATAAACGQVEDNDLRRPDVRPRRPTDLPTPTDATRLPPSCRAARRGRAARPAPISTRPPRPASPSTIATPSGSRPTASPRCRRSISGSASATARRCRITGMDYRAANEDDVEAMLVLPRRSGDRRASSAARASSAVDRAPRARSTESEISGTEVGTAIKANAGTPRRARGRAGAGRGAARAGASLRRRERARLDDERRRAARADRRAARDHRRPGAAAGDHADPVPLRLGRARAGRRRAADVGEATENAADDFLGGLNMLLDRLS